MKSENIGNQGYNILKVWENKLFSLLATLKEYEDIDRKDFDRHMNELWEQKVKFYKKLIQEYQELVNYLREVGK